jgi:hypothetical protein
MSLTVDDSRLHAALDGLRSAMLGAGKDISALLVGQQKMLAKTIVNFTPPIVSRAARSAAHESGEPSPSDKKTGENAIERDLTKLITEVDSDLFNEIGSAHGTRNIDTYRTIKATKVHLVWDNLTANAANLPALHRSYQDSRGRPKGTRGNGRRTWNAAIVVEKGMRLPYIKQVQERVGRWKAKWAYAAAQAGAKFPAYISRHFGSLGSKAYSQWNLADTNGPSVIFGGRGRRFGKDAEAVRDAVRFRAKVMVRLTKLILSGYSKDMAKGMRAQSHAKKYAEEAK